MQRRLKAPVSGDWDAKTVEALKAYQSDKGLGPTGIVDPWTFVKLAWETPAADAA